MLQFFLRGPIVAIATLAVIVWVPRAGAVLGLPGDEVMPFLAVTTILFLQWTITLIRPYIERWLIFTRDHSEVRRIRELEERLLTTADFQQLLDSILATLCDFLRVDTAFIAALAESGPRLERAIGLRDEVAGALSQSSELSPNGEFRDVLETAEIKGSGEVLTWHGYWLIPLHSPGDRTGDRALIGLLGVAEPGETEPAHDHERWEVLMALATRAAEALRDRALQLEIFGSLEDLLPEMAAIQRLRGRAQYGGVESLTSDEDVVSSPDFAARVKDALGQYWGGPRLTDNGLMNLAVVRQALDENEGNPQRAMRAVLQQAIENLRPEGQRSMTTAEWILYNILEMRFIQGRKVREVAMRLAMSESDLYRKQRIAIESVAAIIGDMERAAAAEESARTLEPTPPA
jgi:hypothetical protein